MEWSAVNVVVRSSLERGESDVLRCERQRRRYRTPSFQKGLADFAPDESYHVCDKGYLSLFPFLLGLLPADSPHLGAILEMLRDPKHLWSPYGLRSLSASHPEFGQGENYWKGPIWIQMNYLALRALHSVRVSLRHPSREH